jgi:cystathionine gamma-synthase
MAAVYQALKLVWRLCPDLKTVQFGFPYVDTIKLQTKFGFGCEFFGIGDQNDLIKLEQLLMQGQRISAIVCEFPSNPLLHSVDLQALRDIADRFNFLIIVDDTIGGFVNVDLLKYADILVSSLTKSFSGTGNVMAGSLVLNPNSCFFEYLYQITEETFEDSLWCEDAAILELNSRNYEERVLCTNKSTEKIVDAIVDHPKGNKDSD